MPQEESPPEEEKKLGDYRLREVLSEHEHVRVWRAEQISMARTVVVEALKPEALADPKLVVSFLENVRTKAVVEHPAIGSVYEAVESEEAVYYVREVISGQSLKSFLVEGKDLSTLQVMDVLEAVGGVSNYLEENGFATEPLEASDIILGAHGSVRMVNRTVIGSPSAEVAWHDRDLLAGVLKKLLRQGDPGSTRTGRLLGYLTERGEGAVTWMQVVHTAEKVRGDLEVEERERNKASSTGLRRLGLLGMMLLFVVLAFAVLIASVYLRKPKKTEQQESEQVLVHIPAGSYFRSAGEKVQVEEMWVDSGEVTIGGYRRFLSALQLVSEKSRDVYDHPQQPTEKTDHEPEDWGNLVAAAQVGGQWNGRPVTLSFPVVKVDWWDAYAYANWAGAKLPSEKEWTALRRGTMPGSSEWGPVRGSREDLADGVHGLAGNVSEWTRELERNPMLPGDPRRPVICGGSYLQPSEGVSAREWVADRNLRRVDLGFRVIYEKLPE